MKHSSVKTLLEIGLLVVVWFFFFLLISVVSMFSVHVFFPLTEDTLRYIVLFSYMVSTTITLVLYLRLF